jgi:hypothetical protein
MKQNRREGEGETVTNHRHCVDDRCSTESIGCQVITTDRSSGVVSCVDLCDRHLLFVREHDTSRDSTNICSWFDSNDLMVMTQDDQRTSSVVFVDR